MSCMRLAGMVYGERLTGRIGKGSSLFANLAPSTSCKSPSNLEMKNVLLVCQRQPEGGKMERCLEKSHVWPCHTFSLSVPLSFLRLLHILFSDLNMKLRFNCLSATI